MAHLVTDRELRHSIEVTISGSRDFLVVVSPYIDIDEDIKKAFLKLHKDTLKVIVYRVSDKSTNQSGITEDSRQFLRGLPNIEFVSVKNLHAKFFMNDDYTVIASMNLTSSSNHNYEVGVEIDNKKDFEMAKDCIEYLFYEVLASDDSDISKERLKNILSKQLFSLVINPNEVKINGEQIDVNKFKSMHEQCNVKHGYCIRCESTNIDFYPKNPLCPKCFTEWSIYRNSNYEEKHCHWCGVEHKTTINNPLCGACYEVYDFEIEREWKKIKSKDKIIKKLKMK
ncbi:MAG: hypothetical protein BM564_13340 [Bacteroidetes bacterium MedPE-SWsnd-G2]|nr:MAG: hypothetical protein BM564_13340 [Bacteroidetes bacterium MedPE-SWsnd-G2]